jgi:Beta-galactosidase
MIYNKKITIEICEKISGGKGTKYLPFFHLLFTIFLYNRVNILTNDFTLINICVTLCFHINLNQNSVKTMNKAILTILSSFCFLCAWSNNPAQTIKIDRQINNNLEKSRFEFGSAINPSGNSVHINSQAMLFDGKPVLPVMGEIHFSRVPETEWRNELLKMKAGGINIIANYIFWIHHEEIEREFDWSGQRNLRKFIETCKEVGLPVILRIGPWCHGEARNGGIPEWLVTSGITLRRSNPEYLIKVRLWFEQIFKQAEGLQWKDGGSVIGIQIENEYRGAGEHLLTLKKMTQDIGFDVPLYTRTGWPALTSPIAFGEIIPLYGDYADGFWDRSTNEMPGDYWKSYIFRSFRNSTVIATEQLPKQSDKDNPDDLAYPYFTCELGGGMMTSYHRRIKINPMDVYSMALIKVGSGSNLPGYYMYHGGTNPDGKLTTLSEMQNSNLTNHNDLPIKSYDFQAPLDEFGQVNPHYHLLRKLHLFLDDFGSELTAMKANFPENSETAYRNDSTLRWSVRSNGESGYVFVNNYQRLKNLSAKENIQFKISLPDKELIFPENPFTVLSGASFFMPFNLNLGNARMIYSTTQPLAKLIDGNESIFVFAQNSGVNPEFVFESEGIKVKSSNVKPRLQNGKIYFNNVKTGNDAAIKIIDKNNKLITIVLLDEETSLSFWKGKLSEKEHLFITNSNLTYHNNQIELTDEAGSKFNLSIYPKPQNIACNNVSLKGKKNGIFTEYQINSPSLPKFNVELVQIKKEDSAIIEIKKGKAGVAEQPYDEDFDNAAVWKIVLPNNIDTSCDILLKFPYIGDVARIYLNNKLLTDNFYNGNSFQLGLKRFAPEIYKNELTIKILPLSRDLSLVYLPNKEQLFDSSNSEYLVDLQKVEIKENVTINLTIK